MSGGGHDYRYRPKAFDCCRCYCSALVTAVAEMEAANSASREAMQVVETRSSSAIRLSRYSNKKRNEGITEHNKP